MLSLLQVVGRDLLDDDFCGYLQVEHYKKFLQEKLEKFLVSSVYERVAHF